MRAKSHRLPLTFLVASGLLAISVNLREPGKPAGFKFSLSPASVAAEDMDSGALAQARSLSKVFSSVAEKVSASVVSVRSVKKAKPMPEKNLQNDPFFERFKDFFGEDFMEKFDAPQQGLGTGVIVDERGYILTNNHVIGQADEIEVSFNGGTKTFKAKLIGVDPKSDLAVIKIEPSSKLTAAKIGDSDSLKIGDWVVAAGNPFGLSGTITAGIVSAKGRSLGNVGQYEDFIQTDAAINPGNSGGPLCNLEGEVVGINTAIFSRSGGYMGVGFAIPSNMAKTVMDSLIIHGKVVRGWLGVGIQNITEELGKSFGYSGMEGALVGQVSEGSPADKAGLKQGDIITSYGSDSVKNMNDLRNRVAATAPGTSVKMKVFREGVDKELSVQIEELQNQPEEEKEITKQSESEIGVAVNALSPELAARLKTKKNRGVVITRVVPGSIGERAGLSTKDIIVSVNGKIISSEKEFNAAVTKEALKRGIRVVVETEGMERFVFLTSRE